jgi:hypothetical protein
MISNVTMTYSTKLKLMLMVLVGELRQHKIARYTRRTSCVYRDSRSKALEPEKRGVMGEKMVEETDEEEMEEDEDDEAAEEEDHTHRDSIF